MKMQDKSLATKWPSLDLLVQSIHSGLIALALPALQESSFNKNCKMPA